MELYAEKGDRKYERAALKYLARYMAEGGRVTDRCRPVAVVVDERCLLMRGL